MNSVNDDRPQSKGMAAGQRSGTSHTRPNTSFTAPVAIGLATILAVFVGGGVWAATTSLDRAVIAGAEAAVKPRPTAVETDRLALITTVHVSEGQRVQAGDRLITLDARDVAADLAAETRRIDALKVRLARLDAESRGESDFAVPVRHDPTASPSGSDFIQAERAILKARIHSDRSSIALLTGEIAAMRRQLESMAGEIGQYQALGETYDQQAERLRPLAERGVVRADDITALERRRMEVDAEIRSLDSRRVDITGRIALADLRMAQVQAERQRVISEEMHKARADLLTSEQRAGTLRLMLDRSVVRAEHDGIVFRLAVESPGEAASPGQPLMFIVQGGATLVAKGRLAIEDIKDVDVGKEARIQLVSYTGSGNLMMHGPIERLSPHAISDPNTGMAYFEIEVGLDMDQYRALTGRLPLPGEPMQLLVTIREETVFETIMSPLTERLPSLFPM